MRSAARIQLVAGLLAVAAGVAMAQEFEITWSTIDGGGTTNSTGGDFELSGTIGQPDAGLLSGGDFELSGGFWFSVEPGDCDQDGDVDLADLLAFQECFTGPGGGPLAPHCKCSDLDGDGDLDLSDFVAFQAAFTGSL